MGCETCNLTFLRGISTQLFSLVPCPLGTLGMEVPTWLAFASLLVFCGSVCPSQMLAFGPCVDRGVKPS